MTTRIAEAQTREREREDAVLVEAERIRAQRAAERIAALKGQREEREVAKFLQGPIPADGDRLEAVEGFNPRHLRTFVSLSIATAGDLRAALASGRKHAIARECVTTRRRWGQILRGLVYTRLELARDERARNRPLACVMEWAAGASCSELARKQGVTSNRIRQIVQKGLRMVLHPKGDLVRRAAFFKVAEAAGRDTHRYVTNAIAQRKRWEEWRRENAEAH